MAELILPVDAGQLPSGACPSSYQEMANLFAAIYTVTFPTSFTGITVSATKPSDTTQAWLQLDSFGRPTRLYYFSSGAWLSLHPQVPGFTMLWTTALPTFTSFDGGDANPLSAISGPMWEAVTDLNARFPVGAGTLPSGTVISVGGTGGEEKHALTVAELAVHGHAFSVIAKNNTGSGTGAITGGTDNVTEDGRFDGVTANAGSGDGHNTMPPYTGVYFLRRTARMFYAV